MPRRLTRNEEETLWAHDRMAAVWDQINPPRLKDPNFGEFLSRIPRGGVLLDSGCATGSRDVPLVRSEGFRYVGVDLSKKMLAVGASKWSGQASFLTMDVRELAFRSASFDAFLLVGVLQNVYHKDALLVLGEHHRVLRPGGVGLLTVVTLGHGARMHRSSFTKETTLVISWEEKSFASLLGQAGFRTLRRWQGKQFTLYIVEKEA